MIADVEQWMRQLIEAASTEPSNRVFVYRKVLHLAWLEGFSAGQYAERQDRRLVDELRDEEKAALARQEGTNA